MTAIDNDKRKNIEGAIFLILFCLTIPAANWMIGHVGETCIANGPCLLPVAPGVMAPSGVLMIGAALVLRDLVQRRLGEDHLITLDALAAISDTALTRETAIEVADNGLPTTFVPGRNLIFFSFAGALAYRRGARHIVAGMCETDYSGYPDCRDDTVKAMQVVLNLGMDRRFTLHTPLMWIDKAGTFAMAEELGGAAFLALVVEDTHSCYLGDRTRHHDWGYGCGECPACNLRAQGFATFMSRRKNK